MEAILYKKPIAIIVNTITALLENYKSYTQPLKHSEDDKAQLEEAEVAIDLIAGALKQISRSKQELKSQIAQLRKDYSTASSKEEKKALQSMIEDIANETKFNDVVGKAEEMRCMLEARMTEAESTRNRLVKKFPTERDNGTKVETQTRDSSCNECCDSSPAEWLTEDNSTDSQENPDLLSRHFACKSVKTPTLSLPNFYGVEEDFPEFWAIYETLIHHNQSLSTVEKMMLLKSSLKGRSDSAIKGIQLIPQNYGWMIETLKKKYGNKPMNRSRIIQRLTFLKPANSHAESCRYTLDKINMLINQMISTGHDIRKTRDAMWTETILQKFPYEIVRSVLIAIKDKDEVEIEDLMREIESQISAKSYVESRMEYQRPNQHTPRRGYPDRFSAGSSRYETLPQRAKTTRDCIFCDKSGHYSSVCQADMDIGQKRKILVDKRLCWICFAPNHTSFQCEKSDCPLCGRRHHSAVCYEKAKDRDRHTNLVENFSSRGNSGAMTNGRRNPQSANYNRATKDNLQAAPRRRPYQAPGGVQHSNPGIEKTHSLATHQQQVVLMTAEGDIWNYNTCEFQKVLFFLDTGAQKTVIQEALANKLGLPKLNSETCVMSGIGGHTEMFHSSIVSLKIGTAYGKDLDILVQTKPVITNGFPSIKLTAADQEFLQKGEICVSNSKLRGEHQNPDVLVGLDYYHNFIIESADNSVITPSGLKIAKTIFGPTLYGKGFLDTDDAPLPVMYGMTAIVSETESEMLHKLFELDGIGISSCEEKNGETLEYYEEYSKQISFHNGIITAPFPLKSNHSDLADNYAVAYRRLISLHAHLSRNHDQKQWYSRTITEYLSKDIVETFHEGVTNCAGTYYMPHSGVWREHKTKPLRVVFDASSKKKNELSLNDVIFKGESFVNKVHDILISSRLSKYILLSDIEAAFTQIRLLETHKDLCRFLWLKNCDKPPTRENIVELRFKRLPFGVTASPSILNMALTTFLSKKNTDLTREIMANLYVDNILLHAQNVDEALQKYYESKAIFAEIGMNLREFVSNSDAVNKAILDRDRAPAGEIKLLGVHYNTQTDRFTVKVDFADKIPLTKRDIVSQINSVYDPIGLAGPLLIKLKSLMREIFDTVKDWENRIPLTLATRWVDLCKSINTSKLSIPRYISGSASTRESQLNTLWVFADASMLAIATCAFMKNDAENTVSSLISGKTRLAPKRSKQTIPKLELVGILIATRLAKAIFEMSKDLIKQISIASDSEIALSWIKTTGKLPVFVDNQRNSILKLQRQLQSEGAVVSFLHVPTALNPADSGTRGLSNLEIVHSAWVNGPHWLTTEATSQLRALPHVHDKQCDEVTGDTRDKITFIGLAQTEEAPRLFPLHRFSRYHSALRTVARLGKLINKWVQTVNSNGRFKITLFKTKNFSKNRRLTAEDITLAETLVFQLEYKHLHIADLQRRFPHKHIIRDEHGVIRHISRMQNAAIDYDTKSPMYLEGNSELARLIIQSIHENNAHCGKGQTLCILRQRFWLTKPSAAYDRYIGNCVICKKYQGLPFGAPDMPALPSDRVIRSKPFQNTGCDFFGPIHSKSQQMMYVCLFTCLTTRAVHLEVVESMSTGAFLECLIRFVSRRGVPRLMRTDCGSNFKLGERVVNSMFESNIDSEPSVMSYSANNGIRWIFNPPGAPWMGGAWERMVGTVKKAFNKAIGRRKLTYTQLSTAMTQIEAIVNTRPLAKMTFSDLDKIPLRPIDFLQGNLEYALPRTVIGSSEDMLYDPDLIQTARQAMQAIEYSERIANRFWEEWNSDYLTTLRDMQRMDLAQPRHKSFREPLVGEIVLIEQQLIPRGNWVYGRITDLCRGCDGKVRSVKVKLPNRSILHRPLNKIYPLELRCSIPDNHETTNEEFRDSSHHDVNSRTSGENDLARPFAHEKIIEAQAPAQTSGETRPIRKSRQRAMEAIRNFEESLEEPQSLNYAHKKHVSLSALTIMLFCMIVHSCAANSVNLSCTNGIITVYAPSTKHMLCIHAACKTFSGNLTKAQFKLPPSAVKKEVNVSLLYPTQKETTVITQSCQLPHICEHSQAFLSKTLIANPHCWPSGAVASVATLLYAVTLVLLLVCFCIRRNRRTKTTLEARPSNEDNIGLSMFLPAPIISNTISLALCLLALISISAGCQHGHMRNIVDLVCTSEGCTYEFSREILFNRVQKDLCVDIRRGNNSVGTFEIRKKHMKLICSKRTMFFTRDTKPYVYSAVRCPQAGSCTSDTCAKLRSNETVSELSRSSRYPGYSGCERSCGGIACGCLLPLPACSFYRIAHVPRNRQIYEVVYCAEWKPLIHIEVIMNIYNKVQKMEAILQPYVEQRLENFAVTAISVQKPQLTVLSKRFAMSKSDSLLVPEGFRLPVECPLLSSARNHFHSCLNRMICACRGTNPPTKCECPKESIQDIKNDWTNHLPILSPFSNLYREENDLYLTTDEGEITISINSKMMLESADFTLDQDCHLWFSELVGCYNCQEGTHLNVTCETTRSAWITIICESNTFPVECGPLTKATKVLLDFSEAMISEICHTTCRNRNTTIKLKGTLNFVPKNEEQFLLHDPQSWQWAKNFDWFKDSTIPDLAPMIDILKKHWKVAIAAFSTFTILTILTYAFGPFILICIVKVIAIVCKATANVIGCIIATTTRLCRLRH